MSTTLSTTTLTCEEVALSIYRPEFRPFPKIARLRRDIIVTEKIDGTNAQIHITDDGRVFAGSRTRWITPQDDNFGFAHWVEGNREELLQLGPGSHFGEWWGSGIQRGYGLKERRFSLFNVSRWQDSDVRPGCCGVVPVLYSGPFSQSYIERAIKELADHGSHAAPGYRKPEGIVVFHTASGHLYKQTIEKDDAPKGIKEPRP